MTREEAIEYMWAQTALYNEPFLYATLINGVTMHAWNGTHPVDENTEDYEAIAGTRVLVTMISRFGDVGIRSRNISPASNGYDCRTKPENLIGWSKEP